MSQETGAILLLTDAISDFMFSGTPEYSGSGGSPGSRCVAGNGSDFAPGTGNGSRFSLPAHGVLTKIPQ